MIKLICKTCGNDILTYPSRRNRKKYCSKECLYNSRQPCSEKTREKMSVTGKFNARFGKNKGCFKKGQNIRENHPNWQGGNSIMQKKYILIYSPGHPTCKNKNLRYVKRSRLVMEKHLGRYLKPSEIVHHNNENTFDDKIENLILCANIAEHKRFHRKIKI